MLIVAQEAGIERSMEQIKIRSRNKTGHPMRPRNARRCSCVTTESTAGLHSKLLYEYIAFNIHYSF